MKRNKILQIAMIIGRVMIYYFIFEVILASSALVYWHFDKNYFSNFQYNAPNNSISQTSSSMKVTDSFSDNHIYSVSNLIPASLYFIWFQFAGSSLLQLLMIMQVISIINSLKDFKTFQQKNVNTIRKIGILYALYFVINIVSAGFTENAGTVSYSFSGLSIVIIISIFILAEIFKEGTKLSEENQLTI